MAADAHAGGLSARVVDALRSAGLSVGTAESCTGGLVCAALTDVAGSSEVVRGGVVSYAVAVKERVLGVAATITRDPSIGVVSAPCAEAMARGARHVLDADLAVSTTGIAGPGGAEPGKPVGTVWFGVSSKLGERSDVCRFEGDRARVRSQAVEHALRLVLDEVERLEA